MITMVDPKGVMANLTGKEKAAALLIGLGPEISSGIIKALAPGEVDKITTELLNTERLDPAVRDAVFEEAYQLSLGHEYISSGGVDFARDALRRALGKEKADELLDKITSSIASSPMAFIKKADPVQLVNYIQNEHPQTLALILANLTPIQTASILAALDPADSAGRRQTHRHHGPHQSGGHRRSGSGAGEKTQWRPQSGNHFHGRHGLPGQNHEPS